MLLSATLAVALAVQAGADRPLVPEAFTLEPVAQAAIDAAWLTDEERSDLRVFHGVWSEADLGSTHAQAVVALNAWQLDDPVLTDDTVAPELRAEALLRRGELAEALELMEGSDTLAAVRIRAQAFEAMGDYAQASAAVVPAVRTLEGTPLSDASALTDGVRALAVRARIEGQPARDYRALMSLLAQAHQRLDRLHWPARLAEAELLVDKHNIQQAAAALHETLALNPRSAEAWFALGRIALRTFDFDGAARAEAALRRLDAEHALAELLHAESRLYQDDPDDALYTLGRMLDRWPGQRRALALHAAASALTYDAAAQAEALARYDAASPGGADAMFETGRFLAMFRQYGLAADVLERAIELAPRWPAPQLELGLMEIQAGRDGRARAALEGVIELDPFNVRAANSLVLLEELAEYAEIETEHFVIRYRPGVDEVVAVLMPEQLEAIHATVGGRFGWEPKDRTIIELHPDHKRFAVRITGMPHVHTIAACTGPIIAMEVPRSGRPSEHNGPFDWRRVVQHEYTHTVTLEQTQYRIPHWLTEAAAVSMELAPRSYSRCLMLADAYRHGTLFDLDEIKWAFVRPRQPGDRSKAYAQGHWMVEYMNERYSPSALVELLGRYFEGEREEDAIPAALGVSRDRFFAEFLEWAGKQVESWALAPEPSLESLMDELRAGDEQLAEIMRASRTARLEAIVSAMVDRIGAPARPGRRELTADQWPELVRPPVAISDAQLAAWREEHPDHPDLLELQIRRRLGDAGAGPEAMGGEGDAGGMALPDAETIELLERYAELRPVDPFPHRQLARVRLAGSDPVAAIPHLEFLDAREENSPVYALRLAELYRGAGRLEEALAKAARAVRIDPYNAPTRELAAAIAVEARDLGGARLHIHALTLLEPDRPQHQRRLERIDELVGG